MSEQELKDALTAKGIQFHHAAKIKKLTELYEQSLQQEGQKEEKATEEVVSKEVEVVSAPVVVPEVSRMSGVQGRVYKTKYKFVVECSGEKCDVSRIDPYGVTEFVRTYSSEDHGEDFKKLAEGFALKNN
jgi:hypothetical protein